jgi:hypothetical protein
LDHARNHAFFLLNMHPHIEFALKFATPAGMLGTFLTLVYTIRNVRRQINAEILMKYTERYEHILDKFPPDALFGRFDSQKLPPRSDQLTLCLLIAVGIPVARYAE